MHDAVRKCPSGVAGCAGWVVRVRYPWQGFGLLVVSVDCVGVDAGVEAGAWVWIGMV